MIIMVIRIEIGIIVIVMTIMILMCVINFRYNDTNDDINDNNCCDNDDDNNYFTDHIDNCKCDLMN